MTLPDRTLRALDALDPDRARAIVKATDSAASPKGGGEGVEVVEVARGTAVVMVPPSRALRSVHWIRLIEIAPARYLVTVIPGTPVTSIEVQIGDLLDRCADDERERRILEALLGVIRTQRRRQLISKAEILFIALDGEPRKRRAAPARSHSKK